MEINKNIKQVLAIDIGASSGRAMLAKYKNGKILMKEIHRFDNNPVIIGDTIYWDILRLIHEIKVSLLKTKKYGGIDSLAIDTWGVDFGLIDIKGNLIENPIHYRDQRTKGMIEESFNKIAKDKFYSLTGNQFMEINTVFQILSIKENRPEILERVDKILMMPDLINYILSGAIVTETSIASTTQLFDITNKEWSEELISIFNLPYKIFPRIIESGTIVGELRDSICEELSIEKCKVIAVASHDTQSALIATPTDKDDFIFLSCGTWSLLGTELENPIINNKSLSLNITNEYAYKNKISFIKNIIGLWLIQESRRQWIKEGEDHDYDQLEKKAEDSPRFKCFIDPDDPVFLEPGNIPKRIREYCKETNQYVPNTKGEVVRCINESLALKYRLTLEEITECTSKNYNIIHLVGGGSNSSMLCQMTSSACNMKVEAGPVEATVLGNIALQYIAMGDIKDTNEARKIIRDSSTIKEYWPKNQGDWDIAYLRFKKIINYREK